MRKHEMINTLKWLLFWLKNGKNENVLLKENNVCFGLSKADERRDEKKTKFKMNPSEREWSYGKLISNSKKKWKKITSEFVGYVFV